MPFFWKCQSLLINPLNREGLVLVNEMKYVSGTHHLDYEQFAVGPAFYMSGSGVSFHFRGLG